MTTQTNLWNTFKHPSAFLPVAMSLFALAVVLTHIVFFGTARQPDEGTAAHLWQLLMAGQLPVVAFFAFPWWARGPPNAPLVLALQFVAGLGRAAPGYF